MIVTGADIETTGLKQEDGHRIVEICFRSYDTDTRLLTNSFMQRVNPRRAIDAKAREIHGISIDDLIGMPEWSDVGLIAQLYMKESDVLICHNMAFDGPFIALELARIGLDIPQVETLCTMKEGRWATPMGKNPNLGELCFALGVEFDKDNAHAADYDVDKMMECFWKGLDRGFYELPKIEAVEPLRMAV